MTESADISFAGSLLAISQSVLPLILGPLALTALLARFAPRAHDAISGHQGLSFYIWALALIIVVGNSVSFLMKEPANMIPQMLLLGAGALAVCVTQFASVTVSATLYQERKASARKTLCWPSGSHSPTSTRLLQQRRRPMWPGTTSSTLIRYSEKNAHRTKHTTHPTPSAPNFYPRHLLYYKNINAA